jgi:hypothetical protein
VLSSTTTNETTTPTSTTTTTATTTTTTTSSQATTTKPLTMLENIRNNGAWSTWNMNKKDKLSILTQLSKSYLEKHAPRVIGRRSIDLFSDVLKRINPELESVLGNLISGTFEGLNDNNKDDINISDQSNIIPTFGQLETTVNADQYTVG